VTEPPLLQVENLSVAFGGRQVLDRISLSVREGELLSIVGPSGCGKSTLLNAISELLVAEAKVEGRIDFKGGRLGYMFQRDALLPWYTALRNVQLGAQMRGVRGPQRPQIARKWLERVHLHDVEAQYPAQLSIGMRQRVSLARVLAYDPALILLDEPFVAVDAFTRLSLHDLVLELRRTTGKTMIVVTHDPDEALLLGTRVIVLERNPGRVHAEFDLDWSHDRSAEELRRSDEFAAMSKQLWGTLLEVGAAASARDTGEAKAVGAAAG
jgi:NitT/TauT family transport system ATP-binding protein